MRVAAGVWPWLFGAELLIKSIAFGFACGKDAYLSSPWNRLDACIVLVELDHAHPRERESAARGRHASGLYLECGGFIQDI